MKKENEKTEKLLNPTGEKFIAYMTRKAVGGHIPADEFGEWEKYKKRCNEVGVSVSTDGFLDMLKTNNMINDVLFPLANSYGYNQLKFKNDMIVVFLDLVKNSKNDDLVLQAKDLHDNILLTLKGSGVVIEKK